MSQINELQQRITAALDRIGAGLDGLDASNGADQSEAQELRAALDDEKLANAQLEERVRSLRQKHDAELVALRAELAEKTTALTQLDAQLGAVRRANQQLRDNNAALRDANAQGVAEPHLINKAMLAELEGLRAARAADGAEAQAIFDEIGRVIDAAEPFEPAEGEDA